MAIRGVDFKWLVLFSLSLSLSYYFLSVIPILIQCIFLLLGTMGFSCPCSPPACILFQFFLILLSLRIFDSACFLDTWTCRVIVAINWKRYHSCTYPLHIWIVVGSLTLLLILAFFYLLYFTDSLFFRWTILLCLFSGSWCLLIMALLREWVCKPFNSLTFYVILAYFITIFSLFSSVCIVCMI